MIKQLYDTFKCWSDKGSVWIISDPHFEDVDCKYMDPNWPDPQSYVDMINKYVHKNDTLVCLGDVGAVEWISKIRAKHKVLVKGNHDSGRTNYEANIDLEVFDADEYEVADVRKTMHEKYPNSDIFITGEYDIMHAPFHKLIAHVDNKLFDEIYEGPLFIGEKILLSHEPIYGLRCCLNVHGHTHGSQGGAYEDLTGASHYNVCSNCVGYKPINLKDILTECPVGKIDSIHRETIDIATQRKQLAKGTFDYDLPYRICSECGEKMYEGFCIGDGDEYYCSDVCLHKHYTEEEYEEMYENDEGYWTSWN